MGAPIAMSKTGSSHGVEFSLLALQGPEKRLSILKLLYILKDVCNQLLSVPISSYVLPINTWVLL